MKKLILVILAALILVAFIVNKNDEGKNITKEKASNAANVDKTKHSINEPSSLWMIVNKKLALPKDYQPANLDEVNGIKLRSHAAKDLKKLLKEAASVNVNLNVISGYRSYSDQASIYDSAVQGFGKTEADKQSARPGYSEHQTGLAVDLGTGSCDLEVCFGETPAGKWLANNAHKYGFIIRYQKGREHLTGYQYEPWHLRYLGVELASKLMSSDQTLEQYFSLPPAPSY